MEENQTGKNVSSGAKKVESLQRKRSASQQKTSKSKQSAPKSNVKQAAERAKLAEQKAAEERLEAAKLQAAKKEKISVQKAQLKQKKLEKKAQLKQKKLEKQAALSAKRAERKQAQVERLAKLQERKAELKAQKIARREMLRNETKAEAHKRREREKKERLALRAQRRAQEERARENRMKAREAARNRRAQERRNKREHKTERRKHAPGFGGWLAAVISLGVACLALSTIVTAGSMRMNGMMSDTMNVNRSTLFEMTSVCEEMDNDLSKLRISSGAEEQRKLVTNLLVDAALMESALERVPVDAITSTDISAFINKTNAYCHKLLSSIAKGKALTQKEHATLNYLYGVNHKLYGELNELTTHMAEKEFKAFFSGKEGVMSQRFDEMGQGTLAEPKEVVDSPFSDEGNVGVNRLDEQEEITQQRAEELLKEYLQSYHVKDVMFTGETVAKSTACYNFSVRDKNGVELYAQITKKGGKLAYFTLYEACADKNFDVDACDTLARDYLSSLGIENVEAVFISDRGMVADITYVSVQNGVRIYPEAIRVRVCESKGRVIGLEAATYWLNHEERTLSSSTSREEAQKMLSPALEIYSAHLALIPVNGEEVLTHEFACKYGEEEYLVYLNAETLQEEQVLRVCQSKGGNYLK